MEKSYFPIFIDLSGKRVVVVGGGRIAGRRIETLLDFVTDGSILVVSPEITDEIRGLWKEERLEWHPSKYREEVLEGADMVLAATDNPQCNEQVAADCRKRGIPVNTAHKKECCDFYFPGIVKKENIVVGVTSSGRKHQEARQVREKIEEIFGS